MGVECQCQCRMVVSLMFRRGVLCINHTSIGVLYYQIRLFHVQEGVREIERFCVQKHIQNPVKDVKSSLDLRVKCQTDCIGF